MPLTTEQKKHYLDQARQEDGMHTEPDDAPTLAQALITGRRRVGHQLPVQGPTPISPIIRHDGVIAYDERLGNIQLTASDTLDDQEIQTLPQLTITQAKKEAEIAFDPETRAVLNNPRPPKTVGYTRQPRLTPKRKG